MDLDSANEGSSKSNMTFAWKSFMMEEVCLSVKCSRNVTCSVMVLCVNLPPVVMSRHRSASMSIPKQKSHSNMLSGKDKSGLGCINAEILAQATPIDSFSYCSKLRIAIGRETNGT